ncbi:MAG TPA: hypothetical protein VD994_19775, partial [Prosthecobacter sp.]|nr:hypothetical protein [Prosthecobacter sp.]
MEKSKKLVITFQDVFQFLTRFVKYWKTGMLLFLLGVTASLCYYTYGKPTYYSRSLVAYDHVTLPIKSETSDLQGKGKWAQISVILTSALNSRWMIERTAEKLGLVKSLGQYETIRNQFVASVRVTPVPGNILQVEVYAYQAWLVRAWPEAMLAAYKEYTVAQRERFRDNALEGYTTELDRLKERITSEQNASAKFEEDNKLIEQYVSNNGLEAVPGEMLTIKTRLDSMNQVLAMVETAGLPMVQQLSLMKKFRGTPVPVGTIMRTSKPDPLVVRGAPQGDNFVASMTSDAPVSPANGPAMPGAPSPAPVIVVPSMVEELEPWERTERSLRAAKQKKEQAALTYLPGHEVMRNLDKEIAELEASLASELATAVTSFKLEKAQMESRFEDLQKRMPDYRRVLNDFDRYKQEYGLMTSGKVLWEAAYADLRKRISTMEHTGIDVRVDFEFQGFTMMRDDIPISPNKQKLLLYGLGLGLGCAVGGCFGLEKLRSTTSLVKE